MIISKDTHPERDLYYLGARVIEILVGTEKYEMSFWEILEKMKHTERISVNLFMLTLDWLFIIGAITKSEEGGIKKCF